jgi:signal transduction histidine kinase
VLVRSLPSKLLAAILIPTVATFAGFSLLCHVAARRALEAELGRRLCAVAAAAAAQISSEAVGLLSAGDESTRTHRNLLRRLTELQRATQVARIYVFAKDQSLRVDTGGTPIGERGYGLASAASELRRVFHGEQAASLLFRGRDGALYKSGYAPILDAEEGGGGGPPRFAVGADAGASFYDDLTALRRTLLLTGTGGVLGMIALAVLLGRRMSRPLQRLTGVARTIETGVLGQPVPQAALEGRDEVAVLAQGIEAMRKGLQARDERLQMMLSGIAHEVRNPLGGMQLFAGLLRDELSAPRPDAEAARGYVARIEREIEHLKAVVGDFLEYARRARPEPVPLPLPPLLAEARESVQAAAPGVAIGAPEVPADLVVTADGTQLRRALLNLLHNAAQACGAGGQVALGARRVGPGPGVEIWVRDSGPGIPPEVLPRIFTPFFTTRQKGTGLGLSFVREIVADHGGEVRVDTGPAGTTFTLALPGQPGPGDSAWPGPRPREEADGERPDHR